MKLIACLTAIVILFPHSLSVKANLSFDDMSLERRASEAHIEDVDEFILISSVVEAESNRDPENIEGRTMIAVCILNRVRDSRFPNTITGVLTAPGQFSTVRGGHSVINRTELSDQAVIEAYNWIAQGDAPEVLYFNCRSYFSGIEPYDLVGGNYFSCDGGIR